MPCRVLLLMLLLGVSLVGCGEGSESEADSKPQPPTKEEILEHIMGTWVPAEGSPKQITFTFEPNGDRTMTQTVNGHKNVSDGWVQKQREFHDEGNFFVFGSSIQIPNFKHDNFVVKIGVYEISEDTMRIRYSGADYTYHKQ